MSISQQYLSSNKTTVEFNPVEFGKLLRSNLPDVQFCCLLGSAQNGIVLPYADLDLAFYLNGPPKLEFCQQVMELTQKFISGVRCDIGILNKAEPIFCFEAI